MLRRQSEKSIQALIDTGSDVTVAGSNIAKQHRWKIQHAELKSVKTANGEHMFIEGLVPKNLSVWKKRIWFDICIFPYVDDLILGIEWMRKQGRMLWDFEAQRIRFGDGEWTALPQETETGCRRLYAKRDVVLPPKQETIVPVRVHRCTATAQPFDTVTESLKIPNLSRVYSSRSVLPANFRR